MAYNPEQLSTMLDMLKNNIELITDYMDASALSAKNAQLTHYIDMAIKNITIEGIEIDYSDIGDLMTVAMYAAWLYEKRRYPTVNMPRMLRWTLNNRLFSVKAAEDA